MKPGPVAHSLILNYEKTILVVYLDEAGNPTVGVGHMDRSMNVGDRITKGEANAMFIADLKRFGKSVDQQVTGKVDQIQFDCIVSMAFNIGERGLSRSSVLIEVNQGRSVAAPYNFGAWRRAGGEISLGLVRRRQLEALIFAHSAYGETWALRQIADAHSLP